MGSPLFEQDLRDRLSPDERKDPGWGRPEQPQLLPATPAAAATCARWLRHIDSGLFRSQIQQRLQAGPELHPPLRSRASRSSFTAALRKGSRVSPNLDTGPSVSSLWRLSRSHGCMKSCGLRPLKRSLLPLSTGLLAWPSSSIRNETPKIWRGSSATNHWTSPHLTRTAGTGAARREALGTQSLSRRPPQRSAWESTETRRDPNLVTSLAPN
eukprot:scaffold748_cov251-Pinguiococcus_pyrenoidosus.AAC.24